MRIRVAMPTVLGLLAAALCATAPAQASPTITEFAAGNGPAGVTLGPDGNVWFADKANPGQIGWITPAGTVGAYAVPTKDAQPTGIATGPDGIWFTETAKNQIGRVTTTGVMSEWKGFTHDKPTGIAAGPDGNLWYAAAGRGGAIGRISPAGTYIEFTAGLSGAPEDITLGPDDNLWFTEPAFNKIGRITPAGTITEFSVGISGPPQKITAGPDGNLWFTQAGALPGIGRISPSGTVTIFPTFLTGAPEGITAGADGNVYFTDNRANAIGQVTPSGAITTFSAGLTAGASLQGIATGADGRLWFAEATAKKIGRMTVAPGAGAVATSAVVSDAATLTAAIKANSQATTYHFEWGTTAAYGQSTASSTAGSGASPYSASAALTGLAASTTYHARIVATNASGTTVGPDRTFTTTAAGAPSATSGAATGVGAGQATLNATVNPETGATTYHFEWGATATYGNRVPAVDAAVGSDGADHPVSQDVTGLAPNQTYHFRVVATSANGTTYGDDETFTTDAVAPGATTAAASTVTAAGATLAGSVDPMNSDTTYRFEWGTTTAYGNSAPAEDAFVAGDHADHPVSEALTGLAPNTTYHFRLVATSAAGSTAGPDQSFATATAAPAVTTDAASAVTADAATLAATIDPNNSATTYRFEWGPTPAYGSTAPAVDADAGSNHVPHAVAEALSGLDPNRTYHFRVVATSRAGTTSGADQAFTTAAAAPVATTAHATGVYDAAATLQGTVDPRNAATTYRFEWGTTTAYGQSTPATDLPGAPDLQGHAVAATVDGLVASTTYHYRLVAESAGGTSYGPDSSFMTLHGDPAPPFTPPTEPPAAAAAPASPAPAPFPAADAQPQPQLGKTAVASVADGTILVRAPGTGRLVPLRADQPIPSGSIVDARNGTLVLENAVTRGGRTQHAKFRGAVFQFSLSRKEPGMVDIRLRQTPSGCGGGAVRAAKAPKRGGSLWAKDKGGRYRTHGRNSVAIVRGTEWTTTETCSGTVTRVMAGAVSVKDLHTHRTVLVRAGHSYRARPAR